MVYAACWTALSTTSCTALAIGFDVQVSADELVIAVEGLFRFGVHVHQR